MRRLNQNLINKLFTRVERLVSLRNLRPKKKEGFLKVISIFSFLGISIGVAVLLVVMSVMNGFRTDLTNKILGLNPHIVIEPSGSNIDNDFIKILKKNYPKFSFSRTINGEAIIFTNENTTGVLIKGISKKDIKRNRINDKIIKGSTDNFGKKNIIIGGELAFDLGIDIGDTINLMSTSLINTPLGSLPKKERFRVTGIFNSGFYEFDKKLIYIDNEDSLSLLDKSEKDLNLEIYLDNPLDAQQIKNNIQEINLNLFIYTWADINKSFFSALKVERNVMFIIITLIVIVAAFNIISGLTILIKNKTKEIAILKCLGLSNTSIRKSFFLTGFLIGLTATISGLIFGTIFSLYIENIRIFLSKVFDINIFPTDIYILDKMPSEISFLSIIIIFTFSIIISIIASLIPIYSISKKTIMNSLKYE